MSKTQRQQRVREIIESTSVSTAAQIVDALKKDGIVATQATVTRDLQDLGAVKERDGKGVRRFVLVDGTRRTSAPLDHLRRMMGEWATSIENSANLVVVRTPPGCAHVVASALDRTTVDGILGTVAGDDTILVIATETNGGSQLAADLRELAGLTVLTKGAK